MDPCGTPDDTGIFELYFLLLSMTDQHSCVWCIISKPAVHCCSVHLCTMLLYTAI